MPNPDTIKSIYPVLNEKEEASAPPPYSVVALDKESEINLQTQISSLIKSGKTAYIAIDSSDENNDLSKNKRKLICILENQKTKIVTVREYDNEGFENNFSMRSTDEIISNTKDKRKLKKVRAIIYVKANELHSDATEIKENKLVTIDRIITNFIKDRKIGIYENFPEMRKAYDAETGDSIKGILSNLKSLLNEMDKTITDFEEKKFNVSILKKLKIEMEIRKSIAEGEYQKSDFYSFSSVFTYFISNKDAFYKEVEQLILRKNYNEFIGKINDLEIKSKKILSVNDLHPKRVFTIHEELTKNIITLREAADKLKLSITKVQLNSLDEAYKDCTTYFNELEIQISSSKKQTNKNVSTTTSDNSLLNSYEQHLGSLEKAIEAKSKGTSENKVQLLKKIINYLQEIRNKIKDLSPFEEVKQIINQIKEFVKEKYTELATPRGFFSRQGESVRLIQDLESQLDAWVKSQEQTFAPKP